MAVGNAKLGAGAAENAGQLDIAAQGVGLIRLAGVDVGFAGEAGCVDDKRGPVFSQPPLQRGGAEDVQLGAGRIPKIHASRRQGGGEGRADIASRAKQENHAGNPRDRSCLRGDNLLCMPMRFTGSQAMVNQPTGRSTGKTAAQTARNRAGLFEPAATKRGRADDVGGDEPAGAVD